MVNLHQQITGVGSIIQLQACERAAVEVERLPHRLLRRLDVVHLDDGHLHGRLGVNILFRLTVVAHHHPALHVRVCLQGFLDGGLQAWQVDALA